MNLNLVEIALFLALAAWAGPHRHRLFLLWPVSFIVLPTARIQMGFPLYLYDIISAWLILTYGREILSLRWGWNRVPWHYVFGALIVVCGIVWPLFLYGLKPQILWVAIHAGLAVCSFAIAAAIFADGARVRERCHLGYGVAASIILLGIIGLLQFGSPDTAGKVAAFFFRDAAADAFVTSKFYAEIAAQRAAGPFGSPNLLGVACVLGGLLTTLLVREQWLRAATLAFAGVGIAASVSRQAFIAVALAAVLYLLLSRPRAQLRFALIAIVAAPLLAATFVASNFSGTAVERFSRWDGGIENDSNFNDRYVRGPERLADTIEAFPSILLVGTSPEVGKLASYGIDTGGRENGFVSISYLLLLYQYGLIGIVAGIAMHLQALAQLRHVPAHLRARLGTLLATVLIFYISDNGPNISETVLMLCMIALGCAAGATIRSADSQRMLPWRRPSPRAPAAIAGAAT